MVKALEEEIKIAQTIGLRVVEFEGKTIGIGYARFLVTYYKTKNILEKRK